MTKLVKVIIVVGVIGILATIGLLIAGGLLVKSITDPANIKQVVAKFMAISDPLPSGFRYFHGYVVSGIPFVQIWGDGVKTVYTFSTMPGGNYSAPNASPDALIDSAAQGAVPGFLGSDSTRTITVSKRGTIQAGGQNMPYVLGHVDGVMSSDKTTVNTFIGAVHSPKQNGLIVLWGERADPTQTKCEPLTVEDVQTLTQAIKSF
jgi:hypothetical protein